MSDNEEVYEFPATTISYEYGELSARVTSTQNLSPDFIDTIVDDLRKQVIAGARQLGMQYTEPAEAADEA